MKQEEIEYTSTGTKLLRNFDRVLEAKRTGKWYPITLQLAPTDVCNLDCIFCSVGKRKQDILKLEDIKQAVDDFVSLNLRCVEVTGGGDPTMYPQIDELLEYLYSKNLKVGMITNGLELKNQVNLELINKLSWLRISLSVLDEENLKSKKYSLSDLDLDQIKAPLGLSYVWNETSNIKKLNKIIELKDQFGARFVRVVPNCLNVWEQEKYKKDILPIIDSHDKIFFQTKKYDVFDKCYIGYLKPFLNADGYVHHCSAAPLYNLKFEANWRICHMKDIKNIWPSNLPVMDTKNCQKGKCFYYDQNKLIDSVLKPMDDEDFI